jgi:hypothetical protein
MVSPLATRLDVKKRWELPPTLVGSNEPVLSSALLTATFFLTLALLTFALLTRSILLLADLLAGGRGFARFIWILLCVHNAFLYS